jgi:hypothetical protein
VDWPWTKPAGQIVATINKIDVTRRNMVSPRR